LTERVAAPSARQYRHDLLLVLDSRSPPIASSEDDHRNEEEEDLSEHAALSLRV
jgi:hypothetical protein